MTTLQEFQDDLYKSGIVPTQIFRDYTNTGGEIVRLEVTYADGSISGLEYVDNKPYQAYTIDAKGKRQVVPCTDSPENQKDSAKEMEASEKINQMIKSHQAQKTANKKASKVQEQTPHKTVRKTELSKTTISTAKERP